MRVPLVLQPWMEEMFGINLIQAIIIESLFQLVQHAPEIHNRHLIQKFIYIKEPVPAQFVCMVTTIFVVLIQKLKPLLQQTPIIWWHSLDLAAPRAALIYILNYRNIYLHQMTNAQVLLPSQATG